MTVFYIVMSVHFLLGALGVFIHNQKLARDDKRKNWLKYFGYLIIFSLVATSIISGKYTFLAFSVLIFSFSSIEILKAARIGGPEVQITREKITFIALTVLLLLMVSYSVFFFLPWRTILFVYAVVIVFDGACQITGHLAGRHQILPAVIPG